MHKGARHSPTPQGPAALILVVDDNEAGRYAKARTLRHAGYDVIEATTGGDGYRLTAERCPALVVLDVKLPDVSGLEVCSAIKHEFPGTMVLQTSATFVTSEDRVRGLEGGADNYLVAPIEPRELAAAVRAFYGFARRKVDYGLARLATRLILESSTDYAIIATDLTGRVTTWNTGARNILGWDAEEIVGADVRVIWTPEDRAVGAADAEMQAALRQGRAVDERWHLRRDGSRFWATGLLQPMQEDRGNTIGYLKILRDRTEQRRLQEERDRIETELRHLNATLEARVTAEVIERMRTEIALRQAQKMEAVGQLAGGIAHDFNNVMQAVGGGASLIRRRKHDAAAVDHLARMVEESAQRGASITRRLLAFARRSDLHAEAVDLAALLDNMREVLAHTLGPNLTVQIELEEALPAVFADKGQLETVLINLAANARDAMPDGGTLTLSAKRIPDGDRAADRAAAFGQGIDLSVTDTGTGMTPEVLARVAEPFFTTKARGKGTGLGLAMARGFAEQSGGALLIHSKPDIGTSVTLRLPASKMRATNGLEGVTESSIRRTSAHVLVVDDEDLVREVIAGGLEERGYAVTRARDATEALALLDAGISVNLLLTDYSMPGPDGLFLVREAWRRCPGLPAIVITGNALGTIDDAALALAEVKEGTFSILRKPLRVEEIAERIGTHLAQTKSRAST